MSSSLPLSRWNPALFVELNHLLARLASQPTTSVLRRLYTKLDEAQPWLLTLTGLPGPSTEDQQVIANSPVTAPDGAEVRITDELLATTNTISSALDLSQLLSAILALLAVQQRARFPNRSDAEIAIYILHESLASLLSFLSTLLRLTLATSETSEAFEQLRTYVEGLLDTRAPLGKGRGDGFLVDHVLVQLDDVQDRLARLVRDSQSQGQARDAQALELATFRVGALRAAQNDMAGMLGTIAHAGLLKSSQVVRIVKWLKKCERPDGVAAAVLSALLAATRPFDSLDDTDPRYETVDAYIRHSKFVVLISNLVYGETWTIPALREAVKLQWSLFYLSALRNETSLLQTVGLDADNAERNVQDAVSGGAFQFLSGLVLALRRDRGLDTGSEAEAAAEDPVARLARRSDPDNDMALFTQLEQFVHWLAAKRHFLRNLKNKEEDVGLRRSQPVPPAANFQAFLSLVAVVHKSLPPDSAEHLWDESTFTSVVLDGRTTFPPQAFWDMITAIADGPSCAAKAYEKLKDTRLSWAALFKFYQHYTEMMPHLFDPVKARQPSLEPMPEEEYMVLLGWTQLLTTVVRGSTVARGALLQAKPHPIQLLFDLVNCDIPTDLKAAVLDAVTAFCARRGDSADDDVVARAVESYERVSFADPTLEVRVGARAPAPIGWLQRMEFAEQEAGAYPLTRAYMAFLTGLVPAAGAGHGRLNNALRRGAVYILDRVLLTQSTRPFARAAERWDVLGAALAFIERALQAFDLSELQSGGTTRAISGIASALADEVGFLVLVRLLSEPAVFAPLASIVDHGDNALVPAVLRIYHRVLDLQLLFADVLLVALSDSSRVATPFRRPLGFQSIDHYLLNHHLSNVTAIALAVGSDDAATALVAVKIVAALAQSPLFAGSDMFRGEYARPTNRLAGIIDASDESIRIAQGFCARVEGDGDDLSGDELRDAERAVLSGRTLDDMSALPIVIRHAILDLLVDGTAPDVAAPNIAHFLLGFDFRLRELGLQDPRAPTSRLSCLRIVLSQLDEVDAGLGLIDSHPTLAAKSAQLVYQLFAGPATGGATLSYASSFTDFSARQLANLPRACPTSVAEPTGTATTPTEVVETTVEILTAYLDFQRWVLSSVALEMFASNGHGTSFEAVTSALFTGLDEDEDLDEGISQRPALLIDLLSNVDIAWASIDADAVQNKVLEFYTAFPFDDFKRPDADWYDLEALGRAATSFRRQLERSGAISGASIEAVAAEAEYIVKRLAAKNHGTEVAIAKGGCLTSWSELLKVAVSLLFPRVDEDRQDVFLFELLDALLDRASTDLAPGIAEILAEATLVAMSTLVGLLADDANLPTDRLTATLLKMLDAAVRPGSTESVRGNLYAAISQYLQLITPAVAGIDDGASVATAQTAAPTSALQRATLAALSARRDRFMATLCRDAMDVRDVWKTECFALLGAIVGIAAADRSVLAPLAQGGFLTQFVRTIKDREMALQECLSPEPENLHAYWVYESKLGCLLALAASRKGAEDLVDAGIFETFATCSFIAVQPLASDSVEQVGTREVVERQHRALRCALELLVRVLSSLSRSPRSGAGHALSFLHAHRESLLILLREDQQNVTITGITECALVISMLSMVVHKVPLDDQRSITGFGAYHYAIMAIAARFFDRNTWADAVDLDELPEAEARVSELNQVTLAYFCATTKGLKAGEGSPVFMPSVSRASGNARQISSALSMPAAVDFLSDLLEAMQDLSDAYEMLVDKLESGVDLDADDLAQVPQADIDGPDAIREAFISRSAMLHNMIESLLLLIWRHMLFYANEVRGFRDPVRPNSISLSLSTQMDASRSAPTVGIASVRDLERTAAALRGVLVRADDLEVAADLGKKPDSYHGMLVRRLKELCAGLAGETDEADETME